jgi:NodT family efflux transporter outer membrane factor (OMF) lipoprotein
MGWLVGPDRYSLEAVVKTAATKYFAFAITLGVVMLGGCAALVGPLPPTREPNASWADAPAGATLRRDQLARWWEGFHDEELSKQIDEALAGNVDLQIAAARVREARAGATVAASTLWPTLNLDAFGGRNKDLSRLPVKPAIGNIATLGLSAQWEIDLLGGNRAGAQAAERQATAAADLDNAARVLLAGEVGSTLFAQRGTAAQLATLRRNVRVAEEALRLAQERFARGLATALDIDRALTQQKTLEAQVPLLQGQLKELGHRLAVLRGHTPGGEAPSARPVPETLPELPRLLPSEWLDARPDLEAARHQVEAANFALAEARSDLFPKFTLLASGGRERIALLGLPALSANIFALGAGLVQPIFDAGRIRAQVDGADARLALTAASYDRTLLKAIEEVENAYVAFDTAEKQQEELRAARDIALRARERAAALYQRGLVDYGAYLDTQRVALQTEDALIQATTRKAIALVALYRAFGGGIGVQSAAAATAQARPR